MDPKPILQLALARSDRVIDAKLAGMVPDRDDAAATNDAVLDNINEAWRLGAGRIAYVDLGVGAYFKSRPAVLDAAPELRGRGPRLTSIQGVNGYGGSVLVAGLTGLQPGEVSGVAYDVTGLLDGSTGPRWGLALAAGVHVAFGATAFTRGWRDASGIGVEWAVDHAKTTDGDIPHWGATWKGMPAPAAFFGSNGGLAFTYRTTGGQRWLTCPRPPLTGLARYYAGYDVPSGRAMIAVDGKVIACTPTSAATPGEKLFADDPNLPLQFNAMSGQGNDFDSDAYTFAPNHKIALAGYCVSPAAIYPPALPGDALPPRIDGKPVNDLLRYFTPSASTVFCLTLQDSPSALAGGYVSAKAAGGQTLELGRLMTPRYRPTALLNAPKLADLMVGLNSPSGACVEMGYGLFFEASNVDFAGGAQGRGGMPIGANYIERLNRCWFYGQSASALYSFMGTSYLDGCSVRSHPQGSTFHVSRGVLVLSNTYCGYEGADESRSTVRADGSAVGISNMNIDTEDPTVLKAMRAVVEALCSSDAGQGASGSVEIDNLNIGSVRKGCPAVLLEGDSEKPATCRIGKMDIYSVVDGSGNLIPSSAVEVHGSTWRVDYAATIPGLPPIVSDHPENHTVRYQPMKPVDRETPDQGAGAKA